MLEVCGSFRVRADVDDDDNLSGTTRLVLRELAQRIAVLDEQLTDTTRRLRRITTSVAPDLVARHGVGPDTASTLLVVAGDTRTGCTRRSRSPRCSVAARSRQTAASGRTGTGSIAAVTGKDTPPSGALRWSVSAPTRGPATTSPDACAEGKTTSEAIRCPKRYIAREMFNAPPTAALV